MKKLFSLMTVLICINNYVISKEFDVLLSDSIRFDTLFTLQKRNVDQIYVQSMQIVNNSDFEGAYYDNFFLDSSKITIANRFNGSYDKCLAIERKPLGLETNLFFYAYRWYIKREDSIINLNGDERYRSYFRINIGDVSTKTKYPYLKIKYQTNGSQPPRFDPNYIYEYTRIGTYAIFTGSIQILNNSIMQLEKTPTTKGVGNFRKVSPLVDTTQFPERFNSNRSDGIFSHYIIPSLNIDPNKHSSEQKLENYTFDTLIPLWKNADLKNLDIIIVGNGIVLKEDIKVISIDSFYKSSIEKISFDIIDFKYKNGKFISDNNSKEITNIKVFDLYGKLLEEGNNNDTYKLDYNKLYFVLFNNQFSKKFYITN